MVLRRILGPSKREEAREVGRKLHIEEKNFSNLG
jgi:hypothetical protein